MVKEIFLDTETTGLDYNSGLYEIGGIIRYGDTYEEFDLFCDIFEDDKIDEQALKIGRITINKICTFPDPLETHEKLLSIFSRHIDRYHKQDKFITIGYGVEFDMKVLRRWFTGLGDDYFGSWFWTPWICVMSLAAQHFKEIRPKMPNFKLKTVLEMAKLDYDDDKLHGALYDARQSMRLYDWLLAQR